MPRASISGLLTNTVVRPITRRDSVLSSRWLLRSIATPPCWEESRFLLRFMHRLGCRNGREHYSDKLLPLLSFTATSANALSGKRLCMNMMGPSSNFTIRQYARDRSNESIEIKMDGDVIRFKIGDQSQEVASSKKGKTTTKKSDVSRKAKLNELRFYRLKAKKKMNSPNPEVRIRYKLEKVGEVLLWMLIPLSWILLSIRCFPWLYISMCLYNTSSYFSWAKRKEAWLIEKLRKYEVPKAALETYDPEILTEEERFYLKRTGEKKKHYVPVGRRGVFGGVVLNMHLHWKKHETVKVICKPCKPGQVHQYAEELARLSRGIIIDIKPNNTVIFYRGKNYVQPDVMSPPDTLSKAKALEKYKYEQSLEHTSEFIEKLENELAEYLEHCARYKKEEK